MMTWQEKRPGAFTTVPTTHPGCHSFAAVVFAAQDSVTLAEIAEVVKSMATGMLLPMVAPLLEDDDPTAGEMLQQMPEAQMAVAMGLEKERDSALPIGKLFARNLKENLLSDLESLL